MKLMATINEDELKKIVSFYVQAKLQKTPTDVTFEMSYEDIDNPKVVTYVEFPDETE